MIINFYICFWFYRNSEYLVLSGCGMWWMHQAEAYRSIMMNWLAIVFVRSCKGNPKLLSTNNHWCSYSDNYTLKYGMTKDARGQPSSE